MYVSPAVRSLRDHPDPDEPVRLHVRVGASDRPTDGNPVEDGLAAAVRAAGGTVGDPLQFGGRVVVVDQGRVGDLLAALADAAIPVEAVETAAVAAPGDAGEDVGDPDAD